MSWTEAGSGGKTTSASHVQVDEGYRGEVHAEKGEKCLGDLHSLVFFFA
jgi:hypothetical protein